MTRSPGAQLVRARVYEPPSRRATKRGYLALSFLPFMFALYVFTPSYKLGRPDPVIERAHRWRTVLAILLAIGSAIPFLGAANPDVYMLALTSDMYVNCFALAPVFLVAAVLVFRSPPRWRADTIRQLLRPTLGALVPFLAGFGILRWIAFNPEIRAWVSDPTPLVALVGLVLLWSAGYVLTSVFLVVRHLFNAVDGNLLLPPVVATLFSWWLILQRVIFPSDYKPLWLDVLITLGGAIVITAMSVWEIRLLARRGVTFTAGPYPPPP